MQSALLGAALGLLRGRSGNLLHGRQRGIAGRPGRFLKRLRGLLDRSLHRPSGRLLYRLLGLPGGLYPAICGSGEGPQVTCCTVA